MLTAVLTEDGQRLRASQRPVLIDPVGVPGRRRDGACRQAGSVQQVLLTPQARAAALEFGKLIPSNLKTQPSTPAAQTTVDRFEGDRKTVVTLDWDTINQRRPDWQTRWNKTIEPKSLLSLALNSRGRPSPDVRIGPLYGQSPAPDLPATVLSTMTEGDRLIANRSQQL